MLPANLNDLIPAHIEGLIESEMPENLTLDYKQQLPRGQSEEKREFLYDVAAMANSAGGDSIFGIAERRDENDKATGVPDCLLGARFANPQEDKIRLSSYIYDSIAPKLIGAVVRNVRCEFRHLARGQVCNQCAESTEQVPHFAFQPSRTPTATPQTISR